MKMFRNFKNTFFVLLFCILGFACKKDNSAPKLSNIDTYEDTLFRYQITNTATVEHTIQFKNGFKGSVNWGDNTSDDINGTSALKHIYKNKGTHQVIVHGEWINPDVKVAFSNNDSESYNLTYLTKATGFHSIKSPNSPTVNITNIDKDFFKAYYTLTENSPDIRDLSSAFAYSKIKSIPRELFLPIVEVTNMDSAFYNCSNLISIPQSLFLYSCNLKTTNSMFANCKSLEGFTTEGNKSIDPLNIKSMLDVTPLYDVDTKTLKQGDMEHMFDGCDKLKRDN